MFTIGNSNRGSRKKRTQGGDGKEDDAVRVMQAALGALVAAGRLTRDVWQQKRVAQLCAMCECTGVTSGLVAHMATLLAHAFPNLFRVGMCTCTSEQPGTVPAEHPEVERPSSSGGPDVSLAFFVSDLPDVAMQQAVVAACMESAEGPGRSASWRDAVRQCVSAAMRIVDADGESAPFATNCNRRHVEDEYHSADNVDRCCAASYCGCCTLAGHTSHDMKRLQRQVCLSFWAVPLMFFAVLSAFAENRKKLMKWGMWMSQHDHVMASQQACVEQPGTHSTQGGSTDGVRKEFAELMMNTAIVLCMNAEHYACWNARRRTIMWWLQGASDDVDVMERQHVLRVLGDEVAFVEFVMSKHPKSSEAFAYRAWLWGVGCRAGYWNPCSARGDLGQYDQGRHGELCDGGAEEAHLVTREGDDLADTTTQLVTVTPAVHRLLDTCSRAADVYPMNYYAWSCRSSFLWGLWQWPMQETVMCRNVVNSGASHDVTACHDRWSLVDPDEALALWTCGASQTVWLHRRLRKHIGDHALIWALVTECCGIGRCGVRLFAARVVQMGPSRASASPTTRLERDANLGALTHALEHACVNAGPKEPSFMSLGCGNGCACGLRDCRDGACGVEQLRAGVRQVCETVVHAAWHGVLAVEWGAGDVAQWESDCREALRTVFIEGKQVFMYHHDTARQRCVSGVAGHVRGWYIVLAWVELAYKLPVIIAEVVHFLELLQRYPGHEAMWQGLAHLFGFCCGYLGVQESVNVETTRQADGGDGDGIPGALGDAVEAMCSFVPDILCYVLDMVPAICIYEGVERVERYGQHVLYGFFALAAMRSALARTSHQGGGERVDEGAAQGQQSRHSVLNELERKASGGMRRMWGWCRDQLGEDARGDAIDGVVEDPSPHCQALDRMYTAYHRICTTDVTLETSVKTVAK